MRDIGRYFDRVSSLVRHSIAVNYAVSYEEFTVTSGSIDGTLWFHDSSRLELFEVIRLIGREPDKIRYRYQYLKGDQPVFRYDNSAHHPHLATFPHHRHDENDQVSEAEEVSLKDVLDEISDLLVA